MYTIFMSLCSLDLAREKRLAKVFIKKREREREREREISDRTLTVNNIMKVNIVLSSCKKAFHLLLFTP